MKKQNSLNDRFIEDDFEDKQAIQINKKIEKLEESQENDNNSSEEEQQKERMRIELEKIKKEIKAKKKRRRENNKVVVGTNFGFDITQFFKFKKRKDLQSGGEGKGKILDQIAGSHLSWVILLYSVCNAAMIPSWIMHISANKLLRISWRFLLQTLMIIPFVLYEWRSGDAETRQKYSLSYIMKPEHLKKAYLSAFATSFWFTIILTTFQWTYISHAMVLGAMANFFLSLGRTARSNGHDLEPGGQLLIIIGIILILVDSFTLRVSDKPAEDWNFINYFYLQRNQIQRILADLAALIVSYVMSRFSVMTADLKSHYPPYLSMLLVNFFISVNMVFTAFFFNGATFDFETVWGVFSIFSQKHFAGFLYMAIILCMGLVMSFIMISKLFPDPIVPGLAMIFQPYISTFFLHISGIQSMPGSYAFIGYVFVIPGNFLILIGQWIFQRAHKKQQLEDQKRLTELISASEEKQRSLKSKSRSKKSDIELRDFQISSDQSPRTRGILKKDTYNQKYQKISYQPNRPNTLSNIPPDQEKMSEQIQGDMKKKQKNFHVAETSNKDQ